MIKLHFRPYAGLFIGLIMLLLAACAPAPAEPAAAPQPEAEAEAEPEANVEAEAEPEADMAAGSAAGGIVNIYSARHYGAVESPFTRFTEETGIEVRLSQGSSQDLLQRIRADAGQDVANPSIADVFLAIDAGTLAVAAEEGLLEPVESDVLAENIPAELRDPQGRWFAFSQRLRTIMYNPETVDPAELSSYADLADPQWAGRLCLRPATHIYTIGLTASMIANLGEAEAEEVIAGWVANDPTYIDSDTRILETIAAGGCDLAITNHYYLANLRAEDPDFPVQPLMANQDEAGVQRNVFGGGVITGAANRENAIRLLEWLATEGQAPDAEGIVGSNNEFPVNPEAALPPVVEEVYGMPGTDFIIDPLPLTELGTNQAAALDLLERVGYGFEESAQ